MTVDELQVLITANTDNLRKELKNTNKEIEGIKKVATNSSKAVMGAVLMGNVATKILSAGISLVSQNLDSAITRLDTLNNFPRVMSNLGISTEDSNASMKRLSDALVGLPTTLDSATMSVQRFTSANGNVKASTEMFIALNNAILSGGSSAEIQKSALEQLSQAYAKGKPDMMEWRTAMTAMPAQLKQVAIAMGYVSADQLGEALRTGKVSMDEFMVKITELNKNGLNGFQSFEEQARNSTGGVATSITNMKTAFTRGLAEIMNAIGQSNIASFFNGIAKAINTVIPYITGFVKACVWAVTSITSLFGGGAKKKIEDTNKSLSSLGTSGNTTAKGIDNATKSANGLKKALNGLASFDEMNVLKENTSSGGADTDSNVGAVGGDLSGIDLSAFDTGLSDVSSKADEIAEHIKGVFGEVGQVLSNIWNSEPVQAYVGAVVTHAQFVWEFWSTMGQNLFNNIQTTWSNISGNVGIILGNMSKLWTTFWTDVNNGIKTWGQPIIDGVSGIFNSIWFDVVDPVIQYITGAWADFSQILVDLWDEHGQTLIDNFGQVVTNVISLFQSIWDNVLEPIITPFLNMLSSLWDNHLKGMVTELWNFIMKLVNGAMEIYNKFIYPVVSWLVETLKPIVEYVATYVSDILGTVWGVISDVFSGIFKALGGVIDFIVGIFTGDWEKAWEGIKSIFTGIWDALVGIFKGLINLIIDVLNGMIRGLNRISFDVPDWVPLIGGQKLGFNIPTIPKLAKGGIVDKPTTALIGEAGKEAIMPLENNTGWIDELADKLNSKNNSDQPIQLIVKIGEDTILSKIVDGINQKAFENNGEVFSV